MADIDIENPGADDDDLRDALTALCGNDFGWPSGTRRISISHLTLTSSAVSTSALETVTAFYVPRRTTIVAMSFPLVTQQAGAECRLGIYAYNNGTPVGATLIVDAGIIDLSTGTGTVKDTAAISTTLDPGWYWLCCQMKNVATQVTTLRISAEAAALPVSDAGLLAGNPSRYYSRAITYGSALITPGSASLALSTGADGPVIALKAA